MERQVCLDTDVVIAILKNEPRAPRMLRTIEGRAVSISSVTLFELLLRTTKLEEVEAFRRKVFLLDFNEEAARRASALHNELKRRGRMTAVRDLFLAATCLAHGCDLATFNRKDFARIRGLHLLPTA